MYVCNGGMHMHSISSTKSLANGVLQLCSDYHIVARNCHHQKDIFYSFVKKTKKGSVLLQ